MKNYPRGPVYIENADGSVSGVLDDLLQQGTTVVKEVQKTTEGVSNPFMEQLIKSKEFQRILAEVETSARNAVRKEASENALDLFLLAVAGGALGGMVLRGTTGAVLGGLLAWYSMSKITGKELDISELNPFPEKKT